jgi:hypothetical protein
MILKRILLLAFLAFGLKSTAQQQQYLVAHSGLFFANTASLCLRFGMEYQKDVKQNWQYGILYENSRYFTQGIYDVENSIDASFQQAIFHYYNKWKIVEDQLWLKMGLGAGVTHIYYNQSRDSRDFVGLTATAYLSWNVRVTKNFWLGTSIIPGLFATNRVGFTFSEVPNHSTIISFTVFPMQLIWEL